MYPKSYICKKSDNNIYEWELLENITNTRRGRMICDEDKTLWIQNESNNFYIKCEKSTSLGRQISSPVFMNHTLVYRSCCISWTIISALRGLVTTTLCVSACVYTVPSHTFCDKVSHWQCIIIRLLLLLSFCRGQLCFSSLQDR